MPVLRVMSLNMGSLLEPDWPARRHEVVAWIDHLDPDVVCLQEVWQDNNTQNTAGWIAEHAAHDWNWSFGGDSVSPKLWPEQSMHFGSAVLSRWPIDGTNYHRLPIDEEADNGFVGQVPWELFHAETAGLDLYSTHLAAAPTDQLHRRVQVRAIDEIIRTGRGTKDAMIRFGEKRTAMPPILCGDFNAEPDSDEVRFLAGLTPLDGTVTFYQDAWRTAGDGGPGITQDWRINPTAASLNVHRKRIDYVFVGDGFQRAGDAGRVLQAQVVCESSLTGDVVASDHAGLCVEIEWPTKPHRP